MVHSGKPGTDIPFGTILPGDVRVLEPLGATPEGSLYQAEGPNGYRVALLVLQPTGGGERSSWERFRLATDIQHPNVAAVYAVGAMEDGSLYVVLEQLDGEPLLHALDEGRVFARGEALDIALQAAAGLQAAHVAGFIHGDLSPQTVLMIRLPYGKPQAKLIGFRLDPANRQVIAPSDEVSAGYASPERLSGSALDERSDVYSLGALLHHLLTGTPPRDGRISRKVPKSIRSVLAKALAEDRGQRYQTMSELREALEQLISAAAAPKRPRKFPVRATAAGLVLVSGAAWLHSNWSQSGTIEDPPAPVIALGDSTRVDSLPSRSARPEPPQVQPSAPPRRPATARSPARQAPARAESRPETRNPSPGGASGRRAAPAEDPRSGPAELARAETNSSMKRGRSASPASDGGRNSVAAEKRVERQVDERDTREALGYVGGPVASSDRDGSPDGSTMPPAARQPEPTVRTPPPAIPKPPAAGPRATSPDARARHELEQHQGLALAIGDALRIGLAEDIAEIRPGLLAVSLAPGGLSVPSGTYNLQRLYLSYSAATRQQDDVVLELWDDGTVYGRFTREGLVAAPTE
ncbi:MAG TPA: protein kinase [Gemmatimonadales bacterium]|nr:protein kinase [Gemmatimonadales bacterium]